MGVRLVRQSTQYSYHMVVVLWSLIPYITTKIRLTMTQNDTFKTLLTSEQPQIAERDFSLEIGHSKSGQNHVLIVKSIKAKGDNPVDVVENMRAMITAALNLIGDFEA